MNIFSVLYVIYNLMINPPNIETVTSFDVDKYQGSWYQVYDNNFNKLFVKDGISVKHYYNYPIIHMSYLNVHDNYTHTLISGDLNLKNTSNPGKFKMNLNSPIINDNYYITKLGPVNDNKYDYSIVTDSLGLSLYVLVRNITEFENNYQDEINKFLNDTCSNDEVLEYLTKPIKINHF